MKQHKNTILLTTFVALLPALIGLLIWNQLPEQVPTHWNFAGEADGYGSRAFAVLGLPLMLAAVHLFCIFMTLNDPQKKGISGKMLQLVFWIIPVISLVVNVCIYLVALGCGLRIDRLVALLVGLLFLILGNYMPKCRRNYTVGYKLPWTLDNDENWQRTHRLGGRLMVVSGLLILLSAVVGHFAVALVISLVLTGIPAVYSYLFYRRQQK